MKLLLLIGAGSFIGGVSRYLLTQFVQARFFSTFPFGTLTVNILGCFLIGVLFGLSDRSGFAKEWQVFLVTGVLGGFTTFSSFSIENVALLGDGQFLYASAYMLASVIIGLFAALAGIAVTRFL